MSHMPDPEIELERRSLALDVLCREMGLNYQRPPGSPVGEIIGSKETFQERCALLIKLGHQVGLNIRDPSDPARSRYEAHRVRP